MSTRDELVAGVPSAAAYGMMGAMGLGLARTDGAEPWIAGALALGLALPALSIKIDPKRPSQTVAGLAGDLRGDWAARANAYGLLSAGLFIPHLALWLIFGLRFWPLGLAVAAAALVRAICYGLVYERETRVPRWSQAPTTLLWLVQTAAGGLLGLSAVEGLLGFPPGLVVWKAALALIGLGLMAHYWQQRADAVDDDTLPWLRVDALAQRARGQVVWLFRAAVVLGLGLPMVMALAADAQTERVLMPVAFLSFMTGLAAHRLLFLALARETPPTTEAV
jgi:hypothetical protein